MVTFFRGRRSRLLFERRSDIKAIMTPVEGLSGGV